MKIWPAQRARAAEEKELQPELRTALPGAIRVKVDRYKAIFLKRAGDIWD